MPGVDDDGNSDRAVYNVFSIVRCGAARRANGQSVASHPRCGAHNSTGNTIETIRADRRDESSLCVAIPTTVAMRAPQNHFATLAADPVRAWRL